MPKYKMRDERGDGAETMVDDHDPFDCCQPYEPPEKDPGKKRSNRLSGSEPNYGSKVRKAPSHA